MTSEDYMKIEGSVTGSCHTSANTIERVIISCIKNDRNEKSLGDTLKEMGFHRIKVEVPANTLSMIFTAERIITQA